MRTINTNSQFAIATHILTLLTFSQGKVLTSEYIGVSVNTNPVFIRRILGCLNKAGLVTSQAGVGGGWKLTCNPASTTLLDIYRAVDEGQLLALHHRTPNLDCAIGSNIQQSLEGFFSEAEAALENVLATKTLAMILQSVLAPAR